jgi:hypothetical protein
MEPTNQGEAPKLSQAIQIDEGKIQEHLGEVVRSTVEALLTVLKANAYDRPLGSFDSISSVVGCRHEGRPTRFPQARRRNASDRRHISALLARDCAAGLLRGL